MEVFSQKFHEALEWPHSCFLRECSQVIYALNLKILAILEMIQFLICQSKYKYLQLTISDICCGLSDRHLLAQQHLYLSNYHQFEAQVAWLSCSISRLGHSWLLFWWQWSPACGLVPIGKVKFCPWVSPSCHQAWPSWESIYSRIWALPGRSPTVRHSMFVAI